MTDNDTISRKAAIDAIMGEPTDAHYPAWYAEIIEQLPSAHPERKTGKWIIRETPYEDTEAKCSCCGFETLVNQPGNGLHMLDDLHFCPSCGACMWGDKQC